MRKILLTSLLMLTAVATSSCSYVFNYTVSPYPSGQGGGIIDDGGMEDDGEYDIKIWCDQRISDLTKTQVGNFETASNGKYKIHLSIDELGEDSAASSMTEDVQSGADIYVFAQDQLSKLKTAGALAAITGNMRTNVEAENEKGAVDAAKIQDKLYALPFTADNGYFMMYDKSIVKEEHIHDMAKIVEDCSNAGKTINYSIFGNGFYAASYFMATGCESTWDINASNKFYQYHDNYNSEQGFIAAKGIRDLKKNNIFGASDDPSKFGKSLGACVTGIWNYQYALDAIGDNLGCCEMPNYTVDGVSYHISSFSGYKLIGVKPQTDSKKVSVCKRIARYLAGEACQTERFNVVGWGPTNKVVQGLDQVKNHPGLKALNNQKPYSKPQVQCPSSWFSSVSALTSSINADSSDGELREALASYESNLSSFLGD